MGFDRLLCLLARVTIPLITDAYTRPELSWHNDRKLTQSAWMHLSRCTNFSLFTKLANGLLTLLDGSDNYYALQGNWQWQI